MVGLEGLHEIVLFFLFFFKAIFLKSLIIGYFSLSFCHCFLIN